MSDAKSDQPQVIACDLKVFTPSELEQHLVVCAELFRSVQEVRDLPTGYAFRLPEDGLPRAVEFISGERRCCPFEAFTMRVEPYGGAIWLDLTGPDGLKTAIIPDLLKFLDSEVAAAAGLH